jgi:hypothetical protein
LIYGIRNIWIFQINEKKPSFGRKYQGRKSCYGDSKTSLRDIPGPKKSVDYYGYFPKSHEGFL